MVPNKRPRADLQVPQPYSCYGLAGSAEPTVQQLADTPDFNSSFSAPASGIGSDCGLPVVSGSRESCVPDDRLRRSKRSWKPSSGCLEGLAFVSREVAQAEEEMDKDDVAQAEDITTSCSQVAA